LSRAFNYHSVLGNRSGNDSALACAVVHYHRSHWPKPLVDSVFLYSFRRVLRPLGAGISRAPPSILRYLDLKADRPLSVTYSHSAMRPWRSSIKQSRLPKADIGISLVVVYRKHSHAAVVITHDLAGTPMDRRRCHCADVGPAWTKSINAMARRIRSKLSLADPSD
jgi:hypothetical protein